MWIEGWGGEYEGYEVEEEVEDVSGKQGGMDGESEV